MPPPTHAPQTLNPKSQIPNPKSRIPNHKSQTTNPRLHTPYLSAETLGEEERLDYIRALLQERTLRLLQDRVQALGSNWFAKTNRASFLVSLLNKQSKLFRANMFAPYLLQERTLRLLQGYLAHKKLPTPLQP